MMKYEKPKLIKFSTLVDAQGNPDCADGASVTDTCTGGEIVTAGCNVGGFPSVACGGGGNVND